MPLSIPGEGISWQLSTNCGQGCSTKKFHNQIISFVSGLTTAQAVDPFPLYRDFPASSMDNLSVRYYNRGFPVASVFFSKWTNLNSWQLIEKRLLVWTLFPDIIVFLVLSFVSWRIAEFYGTPEGNDYLQNWSRFVFLKYRMGFFFSWILIPWKVH
jgi:hypothetical protein